MKDKELIKKDIDRIVTYHIPTAKFWNELIDAIVEYIDDNYERKRNTNIPD